MNPILTWGIDLIHWVQSFGSWQRGPMLFLSFLSNEEFILLALPFLYWCVDPRLGARLAILLGLTQGVNEFFKFFFHTPRPYWVSHRVAPWSTEASYGLPSGHAQRAASLFGLVGHAGGGGLRWVMAVAILLVGFSRISLAVHFPTDVILGWALGGLVLWAFLRWETPVAAWAGRCATGQRIGLACAASMLVLAFCLAGLAFTPPSDPPEWEATAALASPPTPGKPAVNPRHVGTVLAGTGGFFGFLAGLALLRRRAFHDPADRWRKRLLRYAVGITGVVILWAGMRALLPADGSAVSLASRYLRYAVTGLWIGYLAPRLFIKWRL